MQPRRVNFHTLGCKLNFSESSTLAREFERGGFVRVAPTAEADICVINSCSVTEHADKKCRNLIRKLHRRNPEAIIAVTGCYAQLKPQEIAAIEGVDIVLSNNDKGALFKRVVELSGKGRAQVYSCETDSLTSFFAAFSSGDRTRAFLKVQDGCDYCCSYCTIHYARGSSRNMPVADLVAEARQIAAGGQKEIVLTGVNTGDFGRTTGERFIDLLRALNEVEGIERYRISSIEPNLLTDEIIAFCAASPKFMHHFHIPLQSGSDRILGLMRRRYTTARFAERIAAVRRLMPDAFIGIDVIVGFPGETEADFRTTYDFLAGLEPAFLHIFPFSERPGTLREGKDMQESGFESRQKIVRRAEIGLRLAREPDDHVDADEGVGHQPSHGRDPLGEARRGVAAAHQAQNPVRTALERNVEMVHEFRRRGAKCDDFVGQQVRLDRRNAVAFDPFDLVERPQQVDEPLPRRAAEIPRVDARQDDLLLPPGSDLPRLGHEVGDGHVAARTAGVVDRAVGTAVVAPVLHLEEGARAVAARKGREERRERIGFAAVHLRPALARQFNHSFK